MTFQRLFSNGNGGSHVEKAWQSGNRRFIGPRGPERELSDAFDRERLVRVDIGVQKPVPLLGVANARDRRPAEDKIR